MSNFRVLSEDPLNAEPSLEDLSERFHTPVARIFHRNHGAIPSKDYDSYSLAVTSDVPGINLDETLAYRDLAAFDKVKVELVLACAGNRRIEMHEGKPVEGLLWSGSAIANSQFSGPLLRRVLETFGVTLEGLQAHQSLADLHIHFETSQQCEDASFYGSSLPLEMALDMERPVMLATHMGGEPLDEKHGKPCRLVVPGIIGARSVKWLERIIIRDKPSDNFYMSRDYKILPPEATPDTKEEYLRKIEPMMELPLNSEICHPSDGSTVSTHKGARTIEVRGYALGAKGVPIESVKVCALPLTLPREEKDAGSEPAYSELHRIRLSASQLSLERWTSAELLNTPKRGERQIESKQWSWTLFSAEVNIPDDCVRESEAEFKIALVAYATDVNGEKQELQTPYNLRGVAEASWSVARITVRTTE
ncbi:hypothetical protein JCM3766R1_003004 [Sporobolomyces carnicolor]